MNKLVAGRSGMIDQPKRNKGKKERKKVRPTAEPHPNSTSLALFSPPFSFFFVLHMGLSSHFPCATPFLLFFPSAQFILSSFSLSFCFASRFPRGPTHARSISLFFFFLLGKGLEYLSFPRLISHMLGTCPTLFLLLFFFAFPLLQTRTES